jgi:hypothetical protein
MEKCNYNMEKWNYSPPVGCENLYNHQVDWNQTFMVMLNKLSVGLHKSISTNMIIVKVPNKFKDLIYDLEFYNKGNSKLSNRYIIEFIDSDSNIVQVGDKEFEIENYII